MGFYYMNIFSMFPLAIAYVVLTLIFWGIARFMPRMPGHKALLAVIGVVFLVLPVAEELWIAWNFARACDHAGTFITKKAVVDGFYDDTRSTHAGKPTEQAAKSFERSGYRFLEMKGPKGRVVRVEKYEGQWKAAILDRPTARYHYRSRSHIPVSLKVVKHESIVVDTQEQQIIGRETIIGRYAPWFFIGLDAPQMQCYGARQVKGLIHRNVLLPNK